MCYIIIIISATWAINMLNVEARGKGGAANGGGNSWRGAAVFLSTPDDNNDDWYGEGLTLWTWIIIAIISTVVLGVLICLFYKTYVSCQRKHNEESLMTCYLCVQRVSFSQWKQGSHRRKCAETNKEVLKRMKSPENNKIRCPKCGARLRVWPANHGPPFSCSSSHCPIVGRVRSSGSNRFNCFLCNFDLCESCVYRKLGKSVMSIEREERQFGVQRSSIVQLNDVSNMNNSSRDSWMFRDSVHLVGTPSAPFLEFVDEEDPPPSYHQALESSNK